MNQRAFLQVVEALEDRRMLAVTPLSYSSPVQTTIATTGAPVIAADVGDINGDDIPDLVALDGVSAAGLAYTAEPFTGAANGTFKGGNLVVAGGPTLALGDFNGDGDLDLATPSGVLAGKGDGTFGTAITGFNNPTGAVSYIAADFNNDSKLDLAVATYTLSGTSASIGLDILIGNGDGTFKAPIVTNVKTGTGLSQNDAQFFVDDFNGDGDLDVLTPFGLLLGNGDGTFKSEPTPLPVTPNLTNPIFTDGDVNGDGKVDLLMVTSKSSAGQAELLTGNGDGTFTDGGPVKIAPAGTITALTLVDLNADSFPDIIAGVQTSGAASEIALLANNGDGTFGTATTFGVDGAPLEIFAADMNGDTIPDVISVDATPGLTVGVNSTFNASEVAVLLSNSTTSTGGTGTGTTGSGGTTGTTTTSSGQQQSNISLTSSDNPSVLGTPVKFTVALTPLTGLVYPSGSVTLSINGRPIGTGTLNKFGKASITPRRLGLGDQPIRVTYSGDTNFKTKTATISQVVLASLNKSPIVSASLTRVAFKAAFVTGDTGRVTLGFTDAGNASASGTVSVALYLSQNGRIDSSSIPLSLTSTANVAIALKRGQRKITTFGFVAPTVAIGLYKVVALVTPVSGLTTSELSNTTLLDRSKFRAADNQFGVVSRRNRVSAQLNDGSGHNATFSMTGPGVATFTTTSDGVDLTLTGSSASTSLNVVGGAGFKIDHIAVEGAIGSINAPGVNLTDGLSIVGKLKAIVLNAATGGAWAVSGGIGSVRISGALSNTEIFAGANVGRDGVLGTKDDGFATATIDSIYVGGADTSSLVAAGVAPAPGDTIFSKQVLLPKGKIGSITVRGAISSDSRFIASSLPAHAVLANRTVAVDGNVHFV